MPNPNAKSQIPKQTQPLALAQHLIKYFTKGKDHLQRGLDIWKMNLRRNPELARVTIYETVVGPGDEWYTPIASAHSMIHLDSPTINSVIKWVDRAHEPAVKRLCDKIKSGRYPEREWERQWERV